MAASGNSGVERVLQKCHKCVEAGNFYEAHQMYRTVSFRYSGQKKYTEAIDLLYNGARTLLQHNQHSSGADLAMLVIEVLNAAKYTVTEDTTDKVVSLLRYMDPNAPERLPYLNAAIRWTMKVDNHFSAGHPDLHKKCGMLFWQEKNYVQARYHFLHSSDGKNFAAMLIEYHTSQGFTSEVDLFIAQAVLQYLCLQNKDTAHVVFLSYTKDHPDVENGPPFLKPLLNFIWFLLIALEGGKVAVFTVLCEKYQTSIQRDPSYREYLDKIGQIFFGLPPPQTSPQGFFGNLLQSLLVDDEDDKVATHMPPQPTATTPVKQESNVDLD
ncbi:hypothetical protein CHS0354_028370 [Potamilus streckersoni]|uniref:Golgi to ER traffic protein 4 homolog n=1 Tax=Potamilus streckersoni TaxID=2493646 RepID=A0AAE0VIH6_9BIVA|nr:hypothetical protein CHS0354_028370 [Potamilus streckersoni]